MDRGLLCVVAQWYVSRIPYFTGKVPKKAPGFLDRCGGCGPDRSGGAPPEATMKILGTAISQS